MLVRGGERVALLAQTQPTASRNAATRIAETIVANADAPLLKKSLPPNAALNRFSGLILFSDFLAPAEVIRERLEGIAGSGVAGHMIQVLDPAEETLPYNGRTEFLGSSGRERWVADRVEVSPPQISGALCSASRRTRRNGPALRLVVPHSSYGPARV